MNLPSFNITSVERDTGLSKDVLRVWERRYGFPQPARDANGERLYPAEQVERLRQIKRLMDLGHRPGKLISLPFEELALLAPQRNLAAAAPLHGDGDLASLLGLIRQHDAAAYLDAMQQRLGREGLQRFVQDTVAALTHRVGAAWESGSLEVFEEHLFTELTKRVLRQAIATLPAQRRPPRILLTSVAGEEHGLGLLMVEAVLALEGAQCVPLGTEMPLLDIVRASEAHRAAVVGLSFSIAFPSRQTRQVLGQIRELLPATIELWAGGAGVARIAPLQGVRLLDSLEGAAAALADWRATHA